MNISGGGYRFTSERTMFKRDAGVRIKGEFEPSFASIPTAPRTTVKKEFVRDSKSGAAYTSRPGSRRRRIYTTFRRDFIVHRADGYIIRAHYSYGNGEVEVTVTGNNHGQGGRRVDWMAVEKDIFRRLDRAHYHLEPLESAGDALRRFYNNSILFGNCTVNIAVPVRHHFIETAGDRSTWLNIRSHETFNREEGDVNSRHNPGFSSADVKSKRAPKFDGKLPFDKFASRQWYPLIAPQRPRLQVIRGHIDCFRR